jgi:phosphoribosylglycinamide formyltransferase 2
MGFVKKIMLLGSGELGKEFAIAAKRLGQIIIAVDSYANAPAMQVADAYEIINMLDSTALDAVVAKHQPQIIVPEIEAIRTEQFYQYEAQGIQVVPSAKAANYTMNRKAIRDLAAIDCQLATAKYAYASTLEQFREACCQIGFPCVTKPLMSSSGKGQSVIKTEADMDTCWQYAIDGSRGDLQEVIIEEFIPFEKEITLLTVTQKNGETLYCAPIGHVQERGDYQQSWQPEPMIDQQLLEAQNMATTITKALGGAGLWGVEFFITKEKVYFSELSPRPHDTGMVTLAGTQNFNEFELHARAVLALPIPCIVLEKAGASSVILASQESQNFDFDGIENILQESNTDVKIFGKPFTRKYRRMGVVLCHSKEINDTKKLTAKAKELATTINITYQSN